MGTFLAAMAGFAVLLGLTLGGIACICYAVDDDDPALTICGVIMVVVFAAMSIIVWKNNNLIDYMAEDLTTYRAELVKLGKCDVLDYRCQLEEKELKRKINFCENWFKQALEK